MLAFQEFRTQVGMYFQPVMLAILLLGMASGLPLALTGGTLTAWLSDAQLSLTSIGLFAAVGTPYAFKFLWSPLIDATPLPILTRVFGRRRAWLLVSQATLVLALLALAHTNPAQHPAAFAGLAFLIAFASATQDIVFDAWRIERLDPTQYAHGVAMVTVGYRVGMLIAGGGALLLADYYGWEMTYRAMAALMAVAMMVTCLVQEPAHDAPAQNTLTQSTPGRSAKAWLRHVLLEPFLSFAKINYWWAILLFVVLYKLGDAFLGAMTMPFLLKSIAFTKAEVAYVVKLYGFFATLAGTFIGAWLANRLGLYKLLWIAGILHAATNGMFLVQQAVGHDVGILTLGISLENFTGGISSAAFLSYISALCKREFTATHYALLSSLSAFGRTMLTTPAGWFAEKFGWTPFFILSIALALPALWLLHWLHGKKSV